ncbi:MAG TPA: ATP-binding protein [Pyrinomonadaceae bacterium]|nr:ATP-binding protein [Pyrinomonadaceae bacterium]
MLQEVARPESSEHLPSLAEAEGILNALADVYSSIDASFQPLVNDFLRKPSALTLDQSSDVVARYQTLIEQIPAVVFMAFLDKGLGEAYVSPQIEAILGFSQEEWLNDPVRWYRQVHPDDRGRWNIEAAEMFLSGKPLRSVYRVIARDGKVVSFHCEAKMVRHDDGRPWFIHGVAFDITELKTAEEKLKKAHDELELRVRERTAELARANAELANSNAELEQFAYVASHDLQEPLRMITSFTQLLVKRYGGKFEGDADEFIEYIADGAKRMSRLINDLLEYSRVGTRGRPLVPTDCSAILELARNNLRVTIEETGATITSDPLPTVIGDETQLVQLFQNLLGNAIKFRADQPIKIHIRVELQKGKWLFRVSDNGIGIDPQFTERIFIIFQRLHNRATYPGTGIGLAICKKIVERHGGRIWVESNPGAGATFCFLLKGTNHGRGK